MKKLLSAILALAMILSLGITAFAVDNEVGHTITIKNTKDGHQYGAFRIFTGDLNAAADNEGTSDEQVILSDILWGESVTEPDDLLDALKAITIGTGEEAKKPFETCETAAAVAVRLSENNDNSELLDMFARVVSKFLVSSDAAEGVWKSAEKAPYTIKVPGDGYYLVRDIKPLAGVEEDAATKFILKVVRNVAVTTKDDVVTQSKAILVNGEEQKVEDCDVGDTVTFQVTGTVPAMDGYLRYDYVLCDTMSSGITPVYENVTIKIEKQGMDTKTLDTDEYEFLDNVEDQKYTFKLSIKDFIQYKDYAGGTVVFTYTGIVNENALTTTSESNKSLIVYSNDPSATYDPDDPTKPVTPAIPDEPDAKYDPTHPRVKSAGKTKEDAVYVFDFDINLDKFEKGNEDNKLSGAKFVLYKLEDNVAKFYFWNDTTKAVEWNAVEGFEHKSENNKANDAVRGEVGKTITEKTTDENGNAKFAGLDTGTYYLLETDAPDGYNTLANSVAVTIAADLSSNDGTIKNPDDNGIQFEQTPSSQPYVLQGIENNPGTVLPSTGGIGTTIFYVLGTMLMVGAAVILIAKRRVSAE